MSLVLFYFSGTGNTRYIAHRICETLSSRGYEAKAVSIEGLSIAEARMQVDNASTVGLGWPIYGSDIPEIMKRFIKEMPIVESKPLATFCTQMMFSGDGAVIMRANLEAKGYVLKWAQQINMPNNVSIKGIPISCSDDYAKHEQTYLMRARQQADAFADKIYSNTEHIMGATLLHTIAAMSQRPIYRAFVHKHMAKKLGVSDACNGCGLCADMCPKEVLRIIDQKAVHVNASACTLCLRCVDFCPQNAITYSKKVKLPHYKGPDRQTFSAIITDKKA